MTPFNPDGIFLSRELSHSDRQMLSMAFYLISGWSSVDPNRMAPEPFLLKFGYVKDEITNKIADLMELEIQKNYSKFSKISFI